MLMFFLTLSKILASILPALISVAFMTLLERKLLSLTGLRVGPNKISFLGILQPMSDALKLSNKQSNFMCNYSFIFYYLSSFFMLASSLLLWAMMLSQPSPSSFKYSMLIFLMVLSFNSLNSIVSGWSTFSKYSLIGSIRTVSQLISYESVLYFCLFSMVLLFYSFSMNSLYFEPLLFASLLLLPAVYIWIPSYLAELNRTPYDFSEGESELVSGFNTEFGSSSFTLIFLAEYSNIVFLSLLSSFLFFFGALNMFFFILLFFVIWIRAVMPRYRFDKLMLLAWKFFIPYITLYFVTLSLCVW